MRLQLNIFMAYGNMAGMTLKHEGQQFKIANLCNALQFVAAMEQHRLAMIAGGGHELYHELKDSNGHEWVISCRYFTKNVFLEVWVQSPVAQDNLKTEFSWEGSVGEFDRAVKVLGSKVK